MYRRGTYQVDGFSISKDEIIGSLNKAVLEKMFAIVIAQGILKSDEPTVVECSLIPWYPHR